MATLIISVLLALACIYGVYSYIRNTKERSRRLR